MNQIQGGRLRSSMAFWISSPTTPEVALKGFNQIAPTL